MKFLIPAALAIALIGCAPPAPTPTAATPTPAATPVDYQMNYDAIAQGTPEKDVLEKMGEPQNSNESEFDMGQGPVVTRSYTWVDGRGSVWTITVQGPRGSLVVTNKMQMRQ